MKTALLSLLLLVCAPLTLAQVTTDGQPLRPAATFWWAGAGSSSVTDTYLSPLDYGGWSVSLGCSRSQAMKFNPEKWVMQLEGSVSATRGTPAHSLQPMWGGELELTWGMWHRWHTPVEGLTLGLGGSTGIDAGVLYVDRGGNNPAAAKFAFTVNLTAKAMWRFTLGRKHFALSYHPSLPVAGLFFSQEYAESYYEIYLGNRHGLVHAALPWTRFKMVNEVMLDFKAGNSTLRIGYRGALTSTGVNNLKMNHTVNQFVIAIGGEWLPAAAVAGRISPDTKTISSQY